MTLDFLKKRARWTSDWPIARLVGSATYAELLDAAPGVFEPFGDWRGGGEYSSSLSSFYETFSFLWETDKMCKKDRPLPTELNVPTPPNLVSTVLAEGNICGSELKCLLVNACRNGTIDPKIEPLIGSTFAYTSPILSLGEILVIFVVFTFVISVIFSIAISFKKETACEFVKGRIE